MRPGIVAVELASDSSDMEIVILANLITMTPGTLTLDIATDRKVMYIHKLYVGDPEDFRRSIKKLEERTLELLR